MQKVKTFDYMSTAKCFAVLGLVGGVLSGLMVIAIPFFGVTAFVSMVISGVVGGVIGGIVFAALYNYVLKDKLPIEAEV